MQRSKDLWGSDAHEFRPDRWLDAEYAARYNTKSKFVPFHGGPRAVSLTFSFLFASNAVCLPLVSWYKPCIQSDVFSNRRITAKVQVSTCAGIPARGFLAACRMEIPERTANG
jgi:hypothetical protein